MSHIILSLTTVKRGSSICTCRNFNGVRMHFHVELRFSRKRKSLKLTNQSLKLRFIVISGWNQTKFTWMLGTLMYFMILKLESLALTFSRKNSFLLPAGVRNLQSYESARFARCSSRKRNMFHFKEN